MTMTIRCASETKTMSEYDERLGRMIGSSLGLKHGEDVTVFKTVRGEEVAQFTLEPSIEVRKLKGKWYTFEIEVDGLEFEIEAGQQDHAALAGAEDAGYEEGCTLEACSEDGYRILNPDGTLAGMLTARRRA